jgi:hypothetical protein
MKMKIWYRREPDGAIHFIKCNKNQKFKQINKYLKVQEYTSTITRLYPDVLIIDVHADTKRKAYQKMHKLELMLARKLKESKVTIARTFTDIYYDEIKFVNNKIKFINHIERAVCIYSEI